MTTQPDPVLCACGDPARDGEHSKVHCSLPTTWGALTGQASMTELPPLTRAVLADDLRNLAETGGLDRAMVRVLYQAADALEDLTAGAAVAGQPVDLDTFVGWVEATLDSSAISVTVHEHDGTVSPLLRLVRCLRAGGLLDEGDMISYGAVRALAAGSPPNEVAEDHGLDRELVKMVAPLIRNSAGHTPNVPYAPKREDPAP